MQTPSRRELGAHARHATIVLAGYSLFFVWVYGRPLLDGTYLTESDLYEQYLPMFLASPTTWSAFEFGGFPTFADAQDVVGYLPYLLFNGVFHWWTAIALSAHVLAACFTYAYVLNVTGSRPASAFAGLAFAFSEAMMERIAHLTLLHAIAWLPLIVLAIDRVRETGRHRWVVLGAIGLAQCLLAGHPQIALYTYYVCVAYAIAGGRATGARRGYYAAVAAMFLVGALLTGVKTVPILEASQLTARQDTSFSQFGGHANSPAQMFSIVFPSILHEGREAPTYVGLGTLLLAIAGASLARQQWRAAFWLVVGLCGLLLGAGANTPLAYLAYYLPGYDRFRVGARHLFLAAFGAAVLAGFALAEIEAGRLPRRAVSIGAAVLAMLLAIGAVAMALAPGAFQFEQRNVPWMLPLWPGGVWVQFAVATTTIVVARWVIRTRRFGAGVAVLMALLIGDGLYALPYSVGQTGIGAVVSSASAIEQPSVHAARLAAELRPTHHRLLALGGSAVDPVVPAAFARVWGIPIAGGYNPMVLGHYSALAAMDSNGVVRPFVLAPEDAALDLLGVKYLLVRPQDTPERRTFERDGIEWETRALDLSIGRSDCGHRYERSISLAVPEEVEIAAVGLVTFLRCSEDVPQGAEVASVHLIGPNGEDVVRLRAGVDTAETGLHDATLQARAAHRPARVFGEAAEAAPLTYVARATLSSPMRARRLELRAPGTGGWAVVRHLTLIGTDGRSYPLIAPGIWLGDHTRWRESHSFATSRRTDRGVDEMVADEGAITVFENTRVRPRSWIVTEVAALTDVDALETIHRSQLPDGRPFDARRTALVKTGDLPLVTTFQEGATSTTVDRIDQQHIRVKTSSVHGGFLVLSETFYPGWRARVDGEPAAVHRTNVALMGVLVPPGSRTVEFAFEPTSRRLGLAMSGAGVLACLLILLVDVRSSRQRMP